MARNGGSKRLPLPAADDEGHHSGRDGLGVGAHRGSGEVAMFLMLDQAQQYMWRLRFWGIGGFALSQAPLVYS